MRFCRSAIACWDAAICCWAVYKIFLEGGSISPGCVTILLGDIPILLRGPGHLLDPAVGLRKLSGYVRYVPTQIAKRIEQALVHAVLLAGVVERPANARRDRLTLQRVRVAE